MSKDKTPRRPTKGPYFLPSAEETLSNAQAPNPPKRNKPKPPVHSQDVLKVFLAEDRSPPSGESADNIDADDRAREVPDQRGDTQRSASKKEKRDTSKTGLKAKRAARAEAEKSRYDRKKMRKLETTAPARQKESPERSPEPTEKRPKTTSTTKTTSPRVAVAKAPKISRRAKSGAKAPKSPKNPKPTRVKKAVWHGVELSMANGTILMVSGVSAAGGDKFILVEQDQLQVLTPYSAWQQSGGEAVKQLTANGIIIIGSLASVRGAVAQIRRFPRCTVAIQSGWLPKGGFALADGSVLMPDDVPVPLKAFPPAFGILDRHGDLEAWKEGVATPLAEHMLASFLMMVMFAAPLLGLTDRADNIGLELAGPAGFGKSTMQMLMASAAGRAVGGDGETYWQTCNATMNALEEVMEQFHDMTLILDEAALIPGSARVGARGAEMRDMAFRLSAGRVRQRFGDKPKPRWRIIFLLSTNRPIASLLGAHSAEAEAVADRMMTLPLTADRKHGIFDSCPPGYASTGQFADALKRAAAEHYGHAVPAYVQWLVQAQHDHPKGVRKWIARRLAEFIEECGADANNGSERRVAEAFGLVYAAGRLAQRAGVLPRSYRPKDAALACYRLHIDQGRAVRSFDDRLRSIINDPDTIDLDKVGAVSLSPERLKACRAFLYTGRSGDRELLIPVGHRQRVFPDWNSIRYDADVERRLRRSRDRATKDRPIVAGWKDPFYCFDISDLEG